MALSADTATTTTPGEEPRNPYAYRDPDLWCLACSAGWHTDAGPACWLCGEHALVVPLLARPTSEIPRWINEPVPDALRYGRRSVLNGVTG